MHATSASSYHLPPTRGAQIKRQNTPYITFKTSSLVNVEDEEDTEPTNDALPFRLLQNLSLTI
jgi:hypothetical protein